MQHGIQAQSLMRDFASATGLTNTVHEPRRYLWTDAFAVCNYLQLYRQTGNRDFLLQALTLVDQVHRVLGQHRKNSAHRGWLSGLDEEQARLHPTSGGLRIGKRLDERQPGEPPDESLEWEQDGQYFHYLTKWMHALDCVSRDTGDGTYNQWALELARVAHAAFSYTPPTGGTKRLYWKLSIDLSRPLVHSMGQHDPLDGLITYQQLQATAGQFPKAPTELTLQTEIKEISTMCAGHNWASNDPLGIGGLLSDAYKLVQLIDKHHLRESDRLQGLLLDIEYSLGAFATPNQLNLPAEHRLAFRELGLAIGLQAINRIRDRIKEHPENFRQSKAMLSLLADLSSYQPVHKVIENFWLDSGHQSVDTWREHADINSVMLATSLMPDGYLQL
jgi:hypothetical protein